MSKNILAISGSLREGSSNTQILQLISTWLPETVNYHIYDGMATLPHFSPVSESEAYPKAVQELHRQLDEADAILICTPEYAFGLPGSLKNLLDWTVSSSNFVDKPVAVITASSSGQYAHPSLLTTLGALSTHIIEGGTLLIPFIRSKLNAEGNITDKQTEKDLHRVLENVLNTIR